MYINFESVRMGPDAEMAQMRTMRVGYEDYIRYTFVRYADDGVRDFYNTSSLRLAPGS